MKRIRNVVFRSSSFYFRCSDDLVDDGVSFDIARLRKAEFWNHHGSQWKVLVVVDEKTELSDHLMIRRDVVGVVSHKFMKSSTVVWR